jgi:hypothetical protein
MSYTNRVGDDIVNEPGVVSRVVDYHDRVRWGPIIAGLLVALATQLILSALFGAIGASTIENSGRPRSITPDVATNIGIWSTISLLIALFTGGWVTARACGPMNRNTAILNGAILWATTITLSAWLLASGISGAFGIASTYAAPAISQAQQPGASIAQNVPQITAQQARAIASLIRTQLWWFVFGSLLGLIASVLGAIAGTRHPRTNHYTTREPVH